MRQIIRIDTADRSWGRYTKWLPMDCEFVGIAYGPDISRPRGAVARCTLTGRYWLVGASIAQALATDDVEYLLRRDAVVRHG